MFSVVGAPPTQGAVQNMQVATPVAISRAEDRVAGGIAPVPDIAAPAMFKPDPDAIAGPKPSFERSVLEAKLADGMRLPPLLPPEPERPEAERAPGETAPAIASDVDKDSAVAVAETDDMPPLRPDPTERAAADVALLRSLQATGGPAGEPLVDRTS